MSGDNHNQADPARCGCPTIANGDIRCHVCGEYVNKRCWKCGTVRGDGICPNPVRGEVSS